MIIVEGMDASGKSTLVKFLADTLRYTVQGSEGPPRYEGEMDERLERYAQLPTNTIFDRHPIVSQYIYGSMRNNIGFNVSRWFHWLYVENRPFIIYCDPAGRGLNGHARKEHDTDEHLAQIETNYVSLLEHYRSWALKHANYIYRIGDDMDKVLHAVSPRIDLYNDIRLFHERYQLDYDGPPRELSEELGEFRARFMFEELLEYVGFDDNTHERLMEVFRACLQQKLVETSLEKQFDALIDLVYVALGTSYLHGFDFNEGWRRVQTANMKKVRAERASDSKRGSTFDVVKPAGWTAPDLSDLVTEHQ